MERHMHVKDIRQSSQWGKFLESLGWKIEKVGKIYIYIKKVPLFPVSVIKILHPIGPIPYAAIGVIAEKQKALFVLIEPDIIGYSENQYKKRGYDKSVFKTVHSATIRVNIKKSEKKIFASFSENARRNIRKASNENVLIQVVSMKKGIDTYWFGQFYRLFSSLGKMKKFYVPSYEEFMKKMYAFRQNSLLLFALEKGKGEPVAVVWLTMHGNVVTYMHTGITKRGYELLANYLLVWRGMLIAKRKGKTVFDFEAAYDPRFPKSNANWKGYTEFKKRFHGVYLEYPPSWIKIYNPFFYIIYKVGNFFQAF